MLLVEFIWDYWSCEKLDLEESEKQRERKEYEKGVTVWD